MEDSNFLTKLKNAVDSGEFNSEAANKIIKINMLADGVNTTGLEDVIKNRTESNLINSKVLNDKDISEINLKYDEDMERIRKQDVVNNRLALIIDIEESVKLSIIDMLQFVDEVDEMYKKEFEIEDPIFGDISMKIESIRSKYSNIIK